MGGLEDDYLGSKKGFIYIIIITFYSHSLKVK